MSGTNKQEGSEVLLLRVLLRLAKSWRRANQRAAERNDRPRRKPPHLTLLSLSLSYDFFFLFLSPSLLAPIDFSPLQSLWPLSHPS
jgi:hypothetical protein